MTGLPEQALPEPVPRHPVILVSRSVIVDIVLSLGTRPPEAGGILLGPIGSNDVTEFYFDRSANTTGATYSPDHVTLRRKMSQEWMPAGKNLKGFVHSHPGDLAQLTDGDLTYIQRLLAKNPDMTEFVAPLLLPRTRQLCPFVVHRDRPWDPQEATIILIGEVTQ